MASEARQIIERIVKESGDAGASIRECATRAGYSYSHAYKLLEELRINRRVKKIVFTRPYEARFYDYASDVEAPNYTLRVKSALFKFGATGAAAPKVGKKAGVPYQKTYAILKTLETAGEVVIVGERKGARFILKDFIH